MITGLMITVSSPSPIPRQVSSSARYLVLPYSLLLVSSDQFIVSSMGLSFRILPIAAMELTNNRRLTVPEARQVLTRLAVPSTLILCINAFLRGLKETMAAQWYTYSTPC